MEDAVKRIKVFRFLKENEIPMYSEFDIDTKEATTVLQALFYIKENYGDVPAFRRYQCNRGQCCSCLMTINGKPRRACVTKIEDGMVIEPLVGFPIIKDLIVDFGRVNKGYFSRHGTILEWLGHQVVAKPRFYLELKEDLCTGCEVCVKTCPKNLKENVNDKYGLRVSGKATLRMDGDLVNIDRFCHQCDPAACLDVCQTNALVRTASGAIIVLEDKCIGCTLCINTCPYDNITLHMERSKAIKCDLCDGKPKCAEACPTSALKLIGQKVSR